MNGNSVIPVGEAKLNTDRIRIKFCGITRPEDAAFACSLGVDAIGMIFVPDTPRYIGDRLDLITAIDRACDPFVCRVAVLDRLSAFLRIPQRVFDAIQYYEDDLPRDTVVPFRRIRSLRNQDPTPCPGHDHAWHVDAMHAQLLGGTGRLGDWAYAARIRSADELPVILAGGLRPDNVRNAIEAVHPYAVDVSSGIESVPSLKDMALMTSFVREVNEALTAIDSVDRRRATS